MRKISWIVILMLLLTACSADASRGTILRYVENHQEDLEERVETGDFDGIGLPVLEVNAGEKCIEFECGGSGFGPETSYWGFFYSAEDNMYAVWCAPPRGILRPDGEGWSGRSRTATTNAISSTLSDTSIIMRRPSDTNHRPDRSVRAAAFFACF